MFIFDLLQQTTNCQLGNLLGGKGGGIGGAIGGLASGLTGGGLTSGLTGGGLTDGLFGDDGLGSTIGGLTGSLPIFGDGGGGNGPVKNGPNGYGPGKSGPAGNGHGGNGPNNGGSGNGLLGGLLNTVTGLVSKAIACNGTIGQMLKTLYPIIEALFKQLFCPIIDQIFELFFSKQYATSISNECKRLLIIRAQTYRRFCSFLFLGLDFTALACMQDRLEEICEDEKDYSTIGLAATICCGKDFYRYFCRRGMFAFFYTLHRQELKMEGKL